MERHNGLEQDPEGAFVYHDDAQAAIAALQARVKELEEITTVICGHCCEPMEIPCKAVLQSALTQRTAELEAARVDNRTYINERHDNMKQIEQLQADLAERTAERDTARRRVDELEAREVDVVLLREDLEQRTAELEAATRERYHAKKMEAVQKEVADNQTWHVQQLRAELERVRGELSAYKEARP